MPMAVVQWSVVQRFCHFFLVSGGAILDAKIAKIAKISKPLESGDRRPGHPNHVMPRPRSDLSMHFLYAFFAYTSPLPYKYHQSPECRRKWTPIVRTRTPSTTPSGGDNTVCSGQGGACIMMSAGGCPTTGATLPMR